MSTKDDDQPAVLAVERQTATLRARVYWSLAGVLLVASAPGFLYASGPAALWTTFGLVVAGLFVCHILTSFIISPVLVLRRRLEVKNYGENVDDDPAVIAANSLGSDYGLGGLLPSFPVNHNQRLPKELGDIERLARAGRVSTIAVQAARQNLFKHLSHNLKSPLAIMRAHMATITSATRTRDIEKIVATTDEVLLVVARMNSLIESLLTLANVDHFEKEGVPLKRENLAGVVNDVVRLKTAEADARSITISQDSEAGLWVRGQRQLLVELVGALVGNAIRYGPEGSKIDISVKRLKGASRTVQLLIGDRGPGIPPNQREAVFEAFYGGLGSDEAGQPMYGTRLYRALPSGDKSHGLGLNVAHSIVKLHGGTILLESQPVGQGLVVKVLLPTAVAA